MSGAGVHFHEVRFVLHEEDGSWWATSSELGRFLAAGDTRDGVIELCREALEFHHITAQQVLFIDGSVSG